MEGIRKAMNERNLNEGQWKDRKQWSLGVGQHRKSFETDIYIYIYISKGKAIPLQAWTDPEGSRRLRLPDFKTIGM